jgi:hypothetical protein
MAAEYYFSFKDAAWLSGNLTRVEDEIRKLKTFVSSRDGEFWVLGCEGRGDVDRWSYDARVFTRISERILLEISSHPKSVEDDLSSFLSWFRRQTEIVVADEDGIPSGW